MESLNALAEPNRRRIVEMLGNGEQAAGDIVRRFDMSAPAVSQHLKVLREARLVQVRVDGQRRIYSLDPQGFEELESWLARMRNYWKGRLDDLERELRKPEKRSES